ncbi:MAG: ABC transporter ATP-binding protein [Terriglobia bacterium]
MAQTMTNTNEPYIQFIHVRKAFGDQPVLEDVSFDVLRGETVAILGRSGVGKSVTLKHILGFLKPDEGEIYVDGRDVVKMTEPELQEMRRKVTMVFQSGALFDSLTAGENVAYPIRERALLEHSGCDEDSVAARVEQLMGLVDLDEIQDKMPSELSTGMKRAVAIARALAASPEAILYDEPTTMVDPIMAATVGDLILRLKKRRGLTAVVVTHDMRLARKLADRVVFLAEGQVTFFGPTSEMDSCPDPVIQEFIHLDEITLGK